MSIKFTITGIALASSLFILGCDEKTKPTPTPAPSTPTTEGDVKQQIEDQSDAAKREVDKQAEAAKENADKTKEQIEASSDAAKEAVGELSDQGKKLISDIKSAIDNKEFSKLDAYIKQAEALKGKLPQELQAELDGLIAKAKTLMPSMPH